MPGAGGSDWIPWVEGPLSVVVGAVLQGLSRSYRERRAQLMAEERAVKASHDSEVEHFHRQVLDHLEKLDKNYTEAATRLARVEGMAQAYGSIRQADPS